MQGSHEREKERRKKAFNTNRTGQRSLCLQCTSRNFLCSAGKKQKSPHIQFITNKAKVTCVADTNVFIECLNVVEAIAESAKGGGCNLAVPIAVIIEIDGLKHRAKVGHRASGAARLLKNTKLI